MKGWAGLAALMLAAWTCAGQVSEPKRFQFGAALGMGGMHTVIKPSVDVHYAKTTLRVAPGLFFFSVGVQQRFSFARQRQYNKGRTMLVSFAYHDDWLLMRTRRALFRDDQRRDVKLFMLMAGVRYPLDPRGRIYCEAAIGPMLAWERFYPAQDGTTIGPKVHIYPMMSFCVGGIFTDRRYYRQKF